MREITVLGAMPIGNDTAVEGTMTVVKATIPGAPIFDQDSDAERIVKFLWDVLPGGTLDRVFAKMCKRKASQLVVAHKRKS